MKSTNPMQSRRGIHCPGIVGLHCSGVGLYNPVDNRLHCQVGKKLNCLGNS